MKNVFFNDEVLSAEKEIYTSLKIPSLVLMENAGANSADHIIRNFSDRLSKVIIVTGKGNNAGDGFVLARHLVIKNIPVKVLTLYAEKELRGDALANYTILKNLKSKTLEIIYCKDKKALSKEIDPQDKLIIDAIFGVGFNGKLSASMKMLIEFINSLKDKTIISLDIPSGLYNYNQDAPCIKADITLTMGVRKFHSLFYKGRENCGRLEVMNIGIPEMEFTNRNTAQIFRTVSDDIIDLLPVRKLNSNKYSNGKVFILSGSEGLTGAAYLCSLSALRSGCGAVITGVPKSLNK